MLLFSLPSGVTVTQQTLDLLFQVRILARQPPDSFNISAASTANRPYVEASSLALQRSTIVSIARRICCASVATVTMVR